MSIATNRTSTQDKAWRRYRFTDDEFDRLVRAGILRPDARVFLWNGEIIQPVAEDQPHISIVYNLVLLLASRFPTAEWTVNVDQPVQVRARYRPQPDLVVLRGPRPAWSVRGRVPSPRDVALLIEISDATYVKDAGPKLRKYAAAGIDPYWIVNVDEMRIEVHTRPEPAEGRYANSTRYAADASVPLIAGLEAVPVREILAGLSPRKP